MSETIKTTREYNESLLSWRREEFSHLSEEEWEKMKPWVIGIKFETIHETYERLKNSGLPMADIELILLGIMKRKQLVGLEHNQVLRVKREYDISYRRIRKKGAMETLCYPWNQ